MKSRISSLYLAHAVHTPQGRENAAKQVSQHRSPIPRCFHISPHGFSDHPFVSWRIRATSVLWWHGTTWTNFGGIAANFPQTTNIVAFSNDNVVDDSDFVIFVVGYNILDCADPSMTPDCPADLNGDGNVDDADFSLFVIAYDDLVCP